VVHIRTTREALSSGLEPIVERHYYLTSLSPDTPRGDPQSLLALARGHWEIENRLHHVKDRTLGEDADRTRRGATILARLRSLAVGLLEQIDGASTPQKQLRLSAIPDLAVRLLRRKRFSKGKSRP